MGLYERFEQIRQNLDVVESYRDATFPGNADSTCVGQVLVWLRKMEGTLPSGTGERMGLVTHQQRSKQVQVYTTDGGKNAKLNEIASRTIDFRNKNSEELIKEYTPWTGKYKLYMIASSEGKGHALGAYFPWSGPVEFYDPNVVHCRVSDSLNVYKLLSDWVRFYDGEGDSPDARWGFEYLYIIDNPREDTKKIDDARLGIF